MASNSRWLYRSLYVTERAARSIADRLGVGDIPCFADSMVYDPDLITRFGRLHRALECEEQTLVADEALVDAFGALFRRHGGVRLGAQGASPERAIAGRIQELMRARCAENISLDELSASAGMTNFQLIGLFKRTVGLTPHAYLVQLRLKAACANIRRGRGLAESAVAAGFCDQSAFAGHFKRRYGITPLQFAQAALPQVPSRKQTARGFVCEDENGSGSSPF